MSSIDYSPPSFDVTRTFNNKTFRFQNHTKGKNQPKIPIPLPLLEKLLTLELKPDELLCSNNGDVLNRDGYRHYLHKTLDSIGLKRLSSHGLRHSCSEIWIQCGANSEDISRLFNHRSVLTTKRYLHRAEKRLQRLAQHIKCY